MKKLLKELSPPVLIRFIKKLTASKYGFSGNFSSWQDALERCSGYDDNHIFEKVKNASLKVMNGEAIYERDSVIFNEIEYSWPMLASLMHVAARNNGRLNVLDFGGSMGSSYFQNRKFFTGIDLHWSIIEQAHFVEFGKNELTNNHLHFYHSIESCYQEQAPNVLLLSGVLQYLEQPHIWIDKFLTLKIEYIIIDRTPISTLAYDQIVIQRVPPSIYKASYPCWIFGNNFLDQFLSHNYHIIETFDTISSVYPNNAKDIGIFLKHEVS